MQGGSRFIAFVALVLSNDLNVSKVLLDFAISAKCLFSFKFTRGALPSAAQKNDFQASKTKPATQLVASFSYKIDLSVFGADHSEVFINWATSMP